MSKISLITKITKNFGFPPFLLTPSHICGAFSNPGNIQLWKDAEAFLLTFNFEQFYNNIQIANKWKNLVDNYKVF